MSSSARKIWIFPVTPENWDIVKTKNIWAVKMERTKTKLSKGDVLIFYVRGSRPPCFMGAYEVVSDWRISNEIVWNDERSAGKIIYPWQIDLKAIQLGTAQLRVLIPKLDFIEHKDAWVIYLRGGPANFKRPISEHDFQLILEELKKPQVEVIFKSKVVKLEEEKPLTETEIQSKMPSVPSHKDLVSMLKDLGEILGFFVKTEDFTPDRTYRCDVTWRDYEDHSPIKVFEIEFSGNIDHALASLTHAYDVWRPMALYLIVLDEKDLNRANKLVEPRIRGAFSRIRGRLKVLTYNEVTILHNTLSPVKQLIKDLASRGIY